MAIHQRREVEVKFRVGEDRNSLEEYRALIVRNGFVLSEKRLETDYLPDTEDGLCKAHGILLRFRKVETPISVSWLLTMKIRKSTDGVMDFHEIETSFKDIDTDTFDYINNALHTATNHQLDPVILQCNVIEEIISIARDSGFTTSRILLDKYRTEYARDDNKVTFDYFPDGMGAYMEIESYTETDLDRVCRMLGLKKSLRITNDYGDLLKLHKQHAGARLQRIAIFRPHERDLILTEMAS